MHATETKHMRGISMKTSQGSVRAGIIVGVALALGAPLACAPQGAQPSPELAAMSDQWATALAAGDIEGIVGLYAPDCRIMPPNAPSAEGHEAVRAIFGGMVAAGLTGDLETIEAMVSGDIGYKLGRYTLMAPDGSVVDKGKFSETWKKTAAGWQIGSDMYSSDLPIPGSGTTLVITHEVEDADHWLAAWSGPDSRRKMFAEHGATNVRVFQSPESAKQMGLVVEVGNMEELMAFISSPESEAAKAEDGVIDGSLRFHAEVK